MSDEFGENLLVMRIMIDKCHIDPQIVSAMGEVLDNLRRLYDSKEQTE
jgi:hypothetical protein